MSNDKKPTVSLSKYEIACVTAGVPATGDLDLDRIITQGLRFKGALEILAKRPTFEPKDAIEMVDELLEEFRKSKK